MRPLRGRTDAGGGTAGHVRSLHSPPRPTAITFDRSAVGSVGHTAVDRSAVGPSPGLLAGFYKAIEMPSISAAAVANERSAADHSLSRFWSAISTKPQSPSERTIGTASTDRTKRIS